MTEPYEPIDCGLHDRMEAWCVQRRPCALRVRSEDGSEWETVARIEDVFTAGSEEFMLLDNGERIRLDRIVAIHPVGRDSSDSGISAPPPRFS